MDQNKPTNDFLENEKEGINFPSTGPDGKTEVTQYNTPAAVKEVADSVNYSDTQEAKPEEHPINANSNVDFPNSNQPAARVTPLNGQPASSDFEFPNSQSFVGQQKAPSPVAANPTNFEYSNDTLAKETLERERQMPVTEEENKTMKKGLLQRIKDFFKGNRKKGL